jgi:hypothetical protein
VSEGCRNWCEVPNLNLAFSGMLVAVVCGRLLVGGYSCGLRSCTAVASVSAATGWLCLRLLWGLWRAGCVSLSAAVGVAGKRTA